MPSCLTLVIGVVMATLLVHAVGWPGLVILAVAGSILGSLLRLLFRGARHP